jgi:hypothetical protein
MGSLNKDNITTIGEVIEELNKCDPELKCEAFIKIHKGDKRYIIKEFIDGEYTITLMVGDEIKGMGIKEKCNIGGKYKNNESI